MLLEEFSHILDLFLEVDLFKDYCPNGIQVEGKKEIHKAATAVSANLQTIEAAVHEGVNVLIVHHGMFWNRDPYPIIGSKKRKLDLLLKNQISLLAYHLPLDAHKEVGNNWRAAHAMGWEDLTPFGEFNGIEIGVKGMFAPVSIDSFVRSVEKYYSHSAATALNGKKMVASAALVSGGAYRELSKAAKAGVDCFITGNFDEPVWGEAYELGMHFLALGHSATERVGPKALCTYICEKLSLECLFLDSENPF